MIQQFIRRLLPYSAAIIWLGISFWLLTIPGSQFPKHDWLDGLQADKFIHIILFFVLVYLFCRPLYKQGADLFTQKMLFIFIGTVCWGYGIAMEFVQENFVSNRSFDVWDIVADGVGSYLGLLPFRRRHKL